MPGKIQQANLTFDQRPEVLINGKKQEFQLLSVNGRSFSGVFLGNNTYAKLTNRPGGQYDIELFRADQKPLDERPVQVIGGSVSRIKTDDGEFEQKPDDAPPDQKITFDKTYAATFTMAAVKVDASDIGASDRRKLADNEAQVDTLLQNWAGKFADDKTMLEQLQRELELLLDEQYEIKKEMKDQIKKEMKEDDDDLTTQQPYPSGVHSSAPSDDELSQRLVGQSNQKPDVQEEMLDDSPIQASVSNHKLPQSDKLERLQQIRDKLDRHFENMDETLVGHYQDYLSHYEKAIRCLNEARELRPSTHDEQTRRLEILENYVDAKSKALNASAAINAQGDPANGLALAKQEQIEQRHDARRERIDKQRQELAELTKHIQRQRVLLKQKP